MPFPHALLFLGNIIGHGVLLNQQLLILNGEGRKPTQPIRLEANTGHIQIQTAILQPNKWRMGMPKGNHICLHVHAYVVHETTWFPIANVVFSYGLVYTVHGQLLA
jgi:hypothetical protein